MQLILFTSNPSIYIYPRFAPEPDEEAGFEPIKHHTVGVGVLILHPQVVV
jgi:hypothetical protein